MLCAKYCREILFCLCEAHSSMAFLCLSSSLEPDWIHKAAAGKFIGTVFCWELLWKVQVSDELLPAIPQKLLLVSEKTPEEFSLYLENSYPSENQLAEYLPVYFQLWMYLLASDPATKFCAVLDLATASTENTVI